MGIDIWFRTVERRPNFTPPPSIWDINCDKTKKQTGVRNLLKQMVKNRKYTTLSSQYHTPLLYLITKTIDTKQFGYEPSTSTDKITTYVRDCVNTCR